MTATPERERPAGEPNIFDVIRSETASCHGRMAVVDGAISLSYSGLIKAVEKLAEMLKGMGLRPLGRVGLVCGNCSDHIIISLAVLAAGGVVIEVASEYAQGEKEKALDSMDAEFLVYREGDYVSSASGPAIGEPLHGRFHFTRRRESRPEGAEYAAISPAFIRFSSGTTGKSKGVILSHRSVVERTGAADGGLKIVPGDRILWVLSMSFHFVVTILLFLRRGATIILSGHPLAESMLDGLTRGKATFIYASPFHYSMMADSGLFPPGAMAGVRMAVSTAVKLSADVASRFHAKFSLRLSEAYGIIEVGLPFMNTAGNYREGSVGRALPGYEVRIADQASDGTGEILLKGPGMLDAYCDPWQVREKILPGGWFHTGDIGRIDADGFLSIVGRVKDVINFTGMKVFPLEVEELIRSFPGVRDACVYGEDHPKYGQLPMAKVVAGGEGVDAGALRRYCYERLASYKVPKGFEFVGEIPKTESGKIIRY